MKALAKDIKSDYNTACKVNDRKQNSRLTIAQGIANMEIFGSASHQEKSLEIGHELDPTLLNPIEVATKIHLSQKSEFRAAYAS